MIFAEAPQLARLVTFTPNRREPIHNWYWYQEGFSRALVDWLILKFGITQKHLVLDPFCGVGTTNLTCKQNAIDSIGLDSNPLAVLASKVKTANYNLPELTKAVKTALKWKFKKPQLPKEKFLRKAFSKANLEYVIFYKEKINEIEDEQKRNFLLLALIDAATKSSWTIKEGALVRIKKRAVPAVGRLFKYKIKKMLRDLLKNPLPYTNTKIKLSDARKINLPDSSIDYVITSPPYLNKVEFARCYKLELSLFFDKKEPIKPYIGGTGSEKEYWKDIRAVLSELFRVCKRSAKFAIVIDGGCYPDRVVEVDKITAQIAQEIGFQINKILIARKLWCTKARTKKIGQMRESVILMEKAI